MLWHVKEMLKLSRTMKKLFEKIWTTTSIIKTFSERGQSNMSTSTIVINISGENNSIVKQDRRHTQPNGIESKRMYALQMITIIEFDQFKHSFPKETRGQNY